MTAVIESLRPINDDVSVYGATAVAVDITAELTLTGGTASEIESAVETALQTLFGSEITIGEDVTLDRLISTIMQASRYIKSVAITAPAADVEIENSERADLGTITLTTSTAGV